MGLFSKLLQRKTESSVKTTQLRRNDFEELDVIGQGTFAQVVLARRKDNDGLFAIKVIDKKTVIEHRRQRDAFVERDIMSAHSYPFILKLHGTFQTRNKLFFILDFAEGGDFDRYLKKLTGNQQTRCGLSMTSVQLYAAELFLALTFLHSHGILYRDLKPENILMTSAGHLLLADFGLSKMNSSLTGNSFVGSPYYVAPEVLRKTEYGVSVDYWSFGILLYRMIYGKPPFTGKTLKEVFHSILTLPVRFPEALGVPLEDSARQLISTLLEKRPEMRLEGDDIKSHPFFAGICFEDVLKLKMKPTEWISPLPPKALRMDLTTLPDENLNRKDPTTIQAVCHPRPIGSIQPTKQQQEDAGKRAHDVMHTLITEQHVKKKQQRVFDQFTL